MARKVLEITLKSLTIQHNGEITRHLRNSRALIPQGGYPC
jgi:hypothetical protein